MESLNKRFENDPDIERVVMINYGDYPVETLPERAKSHVDGIRLAFHKKNLEEAVSAAQEITARGYKLYMQPMVTKSYTQTEFDNMLLLVNRCAPYAFYIVDSFGSMSLEEFRMYVERADRLLERGIVLGYHAHNNMQLAFSNAIDMCHAPLQRNVILDASVYGMGRGAGNLNTELIADYMNRHFDRSYRTLPLLDMIDRFFLAMMQSRPWGFSPAQYLSAHFDCHPNYATYLIGKNTNQIVNIRNILARLPDNEKASFNQALAEQLYIDALTEVKTPVSDMPVWDRQRHVVLIASGKSLKEYQRVLEEKKRNPDYMLIALNHIPPVACDYYFFSNQKRLNEFQHELPSDKVVITDNLESVYPVGYVIPFREFAFIKQRFIPNIAVIVLQYLIHKGIREVEVAGLDGYDLQSIQNYSYDELSITTDIQALKEQNDALSYALQHLKNHIYIMFLTPSIFQKELPLKILGVIPARYQSSRFEGKPLCMISGVPMIKRTYMQALRSKRLDRLIVATDDKRIEAYCKQESIPVMMTSPSCLTGTDRIAEVAQRESYDLYVNIQGDEPVIDPDSIDEIVELFLAHRDEYVAYNLYKYIDDPSETVSETIIKTVVNEKDELLYMSRLPIPFSKSGELPKYKKQVCVYGFTKKALHIFSSREKTMNEMYEDIEILRFVDMGYKVKMKRTEADSIAVDVPADVQKVEQFLEQTDG
jgi:3-deoxy-D-manno-octulosonate cytidylyltransferase